MSREPDRLDEMKEFFRAAAANEIARNPASRRRRFEPRLWLALFAVLVGAGGVAAATGIIHFGSSTNNPNQHDRYRPAKKPSGIVLTAPDPRGRLRFGVEIYTSRSGADCVEAGQVLNGRLGHLRGNTFHPFAEQRSAACQSVASDPYIAEGEPFGSSFIYYGRAHENVAKIRLILRDGTSVVHDVDPSGAFLFVLPLRPGYPKTATALDDDGRPITSR